MQEVEKQNDRLLKRETQCCGPWLQSETDRKHVRKSTNLPTGFGTVCAVPDAPYQQNRTRLTKGHKPLEWTLINALGCLEVIEKGKTDCPTPLLGPRLSEVLPLRRVRMDEFLRVTWT